MRPETGPSSHARRLIGARQYVLRSDWGEVQPTAGAENAYLMFGKHYLLHDGCPGGARLEPDDQVQKVVSRWAGRTMMRLHAAAQSRLYERRKVVVVHEGAEIVEEPIHVLGGGGTKAAPQGL